MEFEAIPGVGTKTARALAALDDAERALETGNVAAIAESPDISTGRAAGIVRSAIRHRHGDESDFLTTDHAERLYRSLLDELQTRAETEYGVHWFETLYPTTVESRIDEVRAVAERALDRTPPDAALQEARSRVAPLREPGERRIRERCLVTADPDHYSTLAETYPELSVELAEEPRTLLDLARGYSTVIVTDERLVGTADSIDVDGEIRYQPDPIDSPTEIVPERPLRFFGANRETLLAAIALHRGTDLEAPCELDPLEAALESIGADGTVAADEDLERFETALDRLDPAIGEAEDLATDRLRESIDERPVTIEGTDLLSLAEQGAGVDTILTQELRDEYAAAIEAARDHLVERCDLAADEAELAHRAFPDEPTYPVAHRSDPIERLRAQLRADRDRMSTRRKRELAATLDAYRSTASDLVRNALELDVEWAIASFCRAYRCSMPEFGGTGVEIRGGRSPILEEPPSAIEPVDYEAAGVTLLTGVNSGGKTALLDLVGAVVLLAHMGLPVPADHARIERATALHYHAKGSGTLDAGAFESTVREFAAIVGGDPDALVLVDELESITEPGAAANIMAGILEMLDERGMTAIFVSHLADQIIDSTEASITVDGIEACGIEDGTLVVDRTPIRGHLARSTPELIVEKLAHEDDAAVYDRLLEKF